MTEIWKSVQGHEGIYEVSNYGRVRSLDRMDRGERSFIKGRILRPGVKSNGYLQVLLFDDNGNRKNYYVHRLVMNAFVGDCPQGCEVNHIDENKTNNSAWNLEYVTHKRNVNHGTSKQRAAEKTRKAVEQFSADGSYVAQYPSTIEAEVNTGIWHNNISKACKGKAKTAGGFIWKYKNG